MSVASYTVAWPLLSTQLICHEWLSQWQVELSYLPHLPFCYWNYFCSRFKYVLMHQNISSQEHGAYLALFVWFFLYISIHELKYGYMSLGKHILKSLLLEMQRSVFKCHNDFILSGQYIFTITILGWLCISSGACTLCTVHLHASTLSPEGTHSHSSPLLHPPYKAPLRCLQESN